MLTSKRHRHKKASFGQTIVEFALCIPIFIFMCLALVDLGMYVFIEATMGHVVRNAARYGVTGVTSASSTGDWGDAVFQTAKQHNPFDSYIDVTKSNSGSTNGFFVQVQSSNDVWPSQFPRGEKVVFRLTQEFKYMTPFLKLLEGNNNQITIVVETVYQTEQ